MTKNLIVCAALISLALVPAASAEDEATSLSYISYLERYATVRPASQEESIEAVINLPLVAGDRIDTAREARVEVVLADGSWLWLDEYTSLSLDAVAFSRDIASDRTVVYLPEGSIMVEVTNIAKTQRPTRIDGPSETLYLSQPGLYRVSTTRTGGLRLEVWQGLAEVATAAGGMLVRTEYAAELDGQSVRGLERFEPRADAFVSWVEQRRHIPQGDSLQYVGSEHGRQASQLDNYGSWIYLEDGNTWAWQPRVTTGWRPYTAGRWYWTSAGWNWVSYEPWGWMPYHYGSWFFSSGFGWVWTAGYHWSPAWVHWAYWPGYVSWCPSGYYSSWWGHHYGYGYGYGYGHGYDYDHGGNPGGGHGGQGVRRGDVIPGTTASQIGTARPRDVPSRGQVGLDLSGRVRVTALDGEGWNVVAAGDFASPHLTRLVKPANGLSRGSSDGVVAMVRTGALRTAPPSQGRLSGELDRVFRHSAVSDAPDLTQIMTRDSRMPAEQAVRLAKPTSRAELSRSTFSPAVSSAVTSDRAVPSTRPVAATDSASGSRRLTPNLYRPVTESGTVGSSTRTVTPRSTIGEGNSIRQPTTSSSTSGDYRSPVRRPSTTTQPSNRRSSSYSSSAPPTSRSDSSSTRSPSSTTRSPSSTSSSSSSSSSSSRPVIVPRTSSSRSSSTRSPSSSSSSSRSSSARSPSRSSSSSSSSRSSSTRSSSSSSRSSSSSSRSSSSSSSSSSSRKK